jgi:hypothetical protein
MKFSGLLLVFSLFGSTGKIVTFDRDIVGRTPPGWTVAKTCRWEIVSDRFAVTPPYVFAQVSAQPADGHTSLAIFDGMSLRDGDISVRVKPISGRKDQGGGLVWRYRDDNNYYAVRADALANTVVAYKVENGRRIPLGAAIRHDIPANSWSILKISARRNRFEVYLDHRRVLRAQDATFTRPGRTGLMTNAGALTYFDDFRVNPR